MLGWWAENWHYVMGTVGTLATIIFGYLSLRGLKQKKPKYLVRSNNIFSGLEHTVPDVEVKFPGYGQPIKDLTVTKIAFWNAGTETIKKQDIVKEAPITIQAKAGVVFLSASVIESVSSLNKIDCNVNHDRTRVSVTFDYLDHNQGANIQVFHTGTTNADITMHGTIMGASPIRRERKGNTSAPPPIWLGFALISLLWLLWALFALRIFPPKYEAPVITEPSAAMTVESAGIGLLIGTVIIAIVAYLGYIPKPFSKVLRQ